MLPTVVFIPSFPSFPFLSSLPSFLSGRFLVFLPAGLAMLVALRQRAGGDVERMSLTRVTHIARKHGRTSRISCGRCRSAESPDGCQRD